MRGLLIEGYALAWGVIIDERKEATAFAPPPSLPCLILLAGALSRSAIHVVAVHAAAAHVAAIGVHVLVVFDIFPLLMFPLLILLLDMFELSCAKTMLPKHRVRASAKPNLLFIPLFSLC